MNHYIYIYILKLYVKIIISKCYLDIKLLCKINLRNAVRPFKEDPKYIIVIGSLRKKNILELRQKLLEF